MSEWHVFGQYSLCNVQKFDIDVIFELLRIGISNKLISQLSDTNGGSLCYGRL